MKIADILKMDGRKIAPTPDVIFPTRRHLLGKPKVSSVKMTVKMFESNSHSVHSGFRMLLPYVIAYCEENNISYTLQAGFKDGKCYGYFIKKTNFAL
jgi:hypothetical protein